MSPESFSALLIFLAFLFFFTTLGVFFIPDQKFGSLLTDYLFAHFLLQRHYYFIPLFLLFLIVMLPSLLKFFLLRKYAKIPLFRYFIPKLTAILLIAFTALLGSLLIVIMTAWLQLNYLSYRISKDLSGSGLYSQSSDIIAGIKKSGSFPLIKTAAGDRYSVLRYLVKGPAPQSFYKTRLIGLIPDNAIALPKIPDEPILLAGNTLIINRVEKKSLLDLAPVISRTLYKRVFADKEVKEDPLLEIMEKNDYLLLRKKEVDSEIENIKKELASADIRLNMLQNRISNDENKVEVNKDALSQAETRKETDYKNCTSEFTETQCKVIVERWDKIIEIIRGNIGVWEKDLETSKGLLRSVKNNKEALEGSLEMSRNERNSVIYESGLFAKPNYVKAGLDLKDPSEFIEYLHILSHEYLHYQSYVSEEKVLDRFFEEGLTEFYAQKSLSSVGLKTGIAYPGVYKVIKEIAEKIPPSQLEEIYFKKDSKKLEDALNANYGKDFYKDNLSSFTALFYATDKDGGKMADYLIELMRIRGDSGK